jgi:hypothetical protein
MLKYLITASAVLAFSSPAFAAEPAGTETFASTLSCAPSPFSAAKGQGSACEVGATTTPIGWTRKLPAVISLDANNAANLTFTDGTSMAPNISQTANPAGYYSIVAMYASVIANGLTIIIHSSDGVTIDGLAFAPRGF